MGLLLLFILSIGVQSAAAQSASGTLTDDTSGKPIADAAVQLIGDRGRRIIAAKTDESGTFLFQKLADGVYWLRVQQPGYRLVESQPFVVDAGHSPTIPLRTSPEVTTLEGLTIQARDSRNVVYAGFLDRRRLGFGHFYAPEQLQHQAFGSTSESLAALDHAVDYRGESIYFRDRGRHCAPEIIVDGTDTHGLPPDLQPSQIRAVEVYTIPTLVPPELSLTAFNTCGALVIWTSFGLGTP